MTWLPTRELYRMFLDSQWWRNLSIRKRQSVGLCEECGTGEGLQSHHIRYPENWFDTTERDLKVLCGQCHGAKHGIKSDLSSTGGARDAYRKGLVTRKQFRKYKKFHSTKKKKSKLTPREKLARVKWKIWYGFCP